MTFTAIITPFEQNGSLDITSLTNLLTLQFESQITGIVVNGTTAESPTLTTLEQKNILDLALKIRDEIDPKKQIWLGVGDNSTFRVVENIQKYNSCKIDGYLISTPSYNKPPQNGLIAHFLECDKISQKPIMLYNVPSRTGVNLTPNSVLEIVQKAKNVKYIKEANSDISHILELFLTKKQGNLQLEILSGNDDLIPVFANLGGSGVVSVLSNLEPNLVCELSNLDKFYEFLPTIQKCFETTNPIGIKKMLKERQIIESNQVRLPLVN